MIKFYELMYVSYCNSLRLQADIYCPASRNGTKGRLLKFYNLPNIAFYHSIYKAIRSPDFIFSMDFCDGIKEHIILASRLSQRFKDIGMLHGNYVSNDLGKKFFIPEATLHQKIDLSKGVTWSDPRNLHKSEGSESIKSYNFVPDNVESIPFSKEYESQSKKRKKIIDSQSLKETVPIFDKKHEDLRISSLVGYYSALSIMSEEFYIKIMILANCYDESEEISSPFLDNLISKLWYCHYTEDFNKKFTDFIPYNFNCMNYDFAKHVVTK